MHDDPGRESEHERRIREQVAYRDAKLEAKRLKSGDFDAHPWVRNARESKDRADRWSEADAPSPPGRAGASAARVRAARILWVAALLLPALIALSGLLREDAPPRSAGPVLVSLWHGATSESERSRLEAATDFLGTEEFALDLVQVDDMQRSLQAALLRSTPPDVAIVDFETGEQLRMGNRLILRDADGSAAFFPLAEPAPWSRPFVLVALTTGRTPAESDRILALAREIHRLLRDGDAGLPESPP